jgi:hypothetical protein
MDQSVMTFADSGARGSAIGTATEGMLTYLNDSDSYQSWNGSAWVGVGGAATSNAIINGAFDIWQRGTSFTNPAQGAYLADRWRHFTGSTGATRIFSRQSFTPNELNAASFGESPFYMRVNQTVAGTGDTFNQIQQTIEDVRTFAGQTVTLSFWAKASASATVRTVLSQDFGTGGSTGVSSTPVDQDITTSWTRYTRTVTMPSISGKTIGANSYIIAEIGLPNNATFTIDIWGVQLEAGSTATPFRRNANSLEGELAACQRYYQRFGGDAFFQPFGVGNANSTTLAHVFVPAATTFRASPTSIDFSTLAVYDGVNLIALTNATIDQAGKNGITVAASVASGLTQFRPYRLFTNSSANGFIGFSAEL